MSTTAEKPTEKRGLSDPVTLGIIALTLIIVVFLVFRSDAVGGPKIAILETDPLLEAVVARSENTEIHDYQQRIKHAEEALKQKGYIVLRAEYVRSAPDELYIQILE